jgi:hypothetical protein
VTQNVFQSPQDQPHSIRAIPQILDVFREAIAEVAAKERKEHKDWETRALAEGRRKRLAENAQTGAFEGLSPLRKT